MIKVRAASIVNCNNRRCVLEYGFSVIFFMLMGVVKNIKAYNFVEN